MSTGQGNAEIGIGIGIGTTLNCNHEAPIVCHGTQDPCVSDIAFALGQNNGGDNAICTQYGELAGSLTARHDSSPCADRGMNIVAFKPGQSADSRSIGAQEEIACTLESGGGGNNKQAICYENHAQDSRVKVIDVATIHAKAGTGGGNLTQRQIAPDMQVRRLTPREYERLQGIEDDHTAIPGAADGPRYKAIGNSKAVPVVNWIGRRIEAAHRSHTP